MRLCVPPARVVVKCRKFVVQGTWRVLLGKCEIEQNLYGSMENPVVELMDRLLNKRPVEFVGSMDCRTLRGPEKSSNLFKTIGTPAEQEQDQRR